MNKLTLKQAKERFSQTNDCYHEKDHEIKCNIPNSNVVQIMCKACNKIKESYYI